MANSRRIFFTILKAIVSLVIICYLLSDDGLKSVIRKFSDIKLLWLAVGLLFMIISNILGSYQWHRILNALEIKIPFSSTIRFYFTGLFFNNFLLGFVGGDLFRVYDIARTGETKSKALSTIFLDRFIGFMAMTVMALVLGFSIKQLYSNSQILLSVGLFAFLIIFVLVFFYNKPFAKKFEAVGEAILPKKIHGAIHSLYNMINQFKNKKRVFLQIFGLAFIVQSFRIAVHYFACLSLGGSINPLYFFVFIPIVSLITMLPVSFGGFGVRETAAIVLFGYVGMGKATAFSMEIIAYLLLIVSSIPGGLIFIFRSEKNAK